MKLRLLVAAVGLLVLLTAAWLFTYTYPKLTLFDDDRASNNFARMETIFPATRIAAAPNPRPFTEELSQLPQKLEFGRRLYDVDAFLDHTRTTSLTVIRDGIVVAETFREGYDNRSRATSFSVAKSFISTLVGIAIHRGWIGGVDDLVEAYLPEMRATAWEGVTIAQILDMSSGTAFTEKYDDKSTDAFRIFDDMFIFRQSIDDLTGAYPRAGAPGSTFHYASINTHMLAMILRRVSGKSLGALLQEELWDPLGAEGEAYWLTDLHGNEIGFWGLNAIPRDFARLGVLMLADGVANGRRLLPDGWVDRATTPDKTILLPGAIGNDWGYKFHWWVPVSHGAKDYSAIGIWGQFVYVNPEHRIIIVKTSADPAFKANEYQTIEMFRALAAHYVGYESAEAKAP